MTTTTAIHPEARLEHESGYRFRVRFGDDVPELILDEPPPLGAGAGPDPAALLASAIGGCLASSFLHCAKRARIEPCGLEVDVKLTRARNEEGRWRIRRVNVHLVPKLTGEDRVRVRRCVELYESFCTVTESVREGIPVDVLLEPALAPQDEAAA